MLAATITHPNAADPLAALEVGEHPEPVPDGGWSLVQVRAASLNHHDLWALRGVIVSDGARLPRVLGSDAAGTDSSGRHVIVHALVNDPAWRGDETLDPRASLLSDVYDGTLAQAVAVPAANLVPKPEALSFDEAACLPTAWLTAYRMLFSLAGAGPGTTVLVQGAGGGVSTAAVMLGRAAGVRVWVTSRTEEKRARAIEIGADAAFEPGAQLPERADAVLETVGAATWVHSTKAVRPGGTIVVGGRTSGNHPPFDLERVFMAKLRIVGTTMGTREELDQLIRLCVKHEIHPPIDTVLPLSDAREGFRALLSGDLFGKLVLRP